jgi:hypothetical protein
MTETEPEVPTEKWCPDCQQMKALDAFHKSKTGKLGRNTYCKPCNCVRSAKWSRENPERRDARHAAWRGSAKGKERIRAYKLMERYGITPEQFDEAMAEQEGRCKICGQEFIEVPHADHDHVTKRFRGLLCRGCNHGLGNFEDEVDRLLSAAIYLIESAEGSSHLPASAEDGLGGGAARDL